MIDPIVLGEILEAVEWAPTNLNGYNPIATAAPGDWYDADEAKRRLTFWCTAFTHHKSKWKAKPFIPEWWQRDYLATLFGWKNKNGYRRYSKTFFTCGRKQGKTTVAAGIGNSCLFQDGENAAEIYTTGYDREQAGILFDAASNQVLGCPSLRNKCKILASRKRIIYKPRDSFLVSLPASEKGGHGASAYVNLYDEFHLYNTAKHVEMVESLRTATANRENALEVILSTAGFDRTTLYYEELEYARKVRDGRIADPTFLPMIWEAAEDADWMDPAVWKTACPNLGVTVTYDYLDKKCNEAKRNPRLENTFRRLFLNQFTSQETRWISMRDVDECWASLGDLDPSLPSWGGLDMSAVEDLTAFVRVQRKPGGGFRCLGHYWTPHARLEAMRGQGLPVDQWIRSGWLTPIPGAVIDDAFIRRRVLAAHKVGNLKEVGFDPAHARQIRIELEAKGVTMVEVRQGAFTLGEPCNVLEKAVKSGTLDTSGDPILAWCLENVEVKTDDNGNIRPVKPSHGSQKKIDAVSALLNAIQRMVAAPAPKVLTAADINL